jgi:hypothetical protein
MRLRRATAAALVAALAVTGGYWLAGPATVPGTAGVPVRFADRDGRYLDVLSLTVRDSGQMTRAEQFGRSWLDNIPAWLHQRVIPSQYGDRQADARRAGLAAAEELAGPLDTPVLIHPGRVSGTSTGLAWALSALAQHDRALLPVAVASTGSLITGTGVVHPVSAIAEKMASPEIADVGIVFVPHRQRLDVIRNLRLAGHQPLPVVVGVRDVREALVLLCVLSGSDSRLCRGPAVVNRPRGVAAVKLSMENAGLCGQLRDSFPSATYRCQPGDGVLVSTRPLRR